MFHSLKTFFNKARDMMYFKRLIQIPRLPDVRAQAWKEKQWLQSQPPTSMSNTLIYDECYHCVLLSGLLFLWTGLYDIIHTFTCIWYHAITSLTNSCLLFDFLSVPSELPSCCLSGKTCEASCGHPWWGWTRAGWWWRSWATHRGQRRFNVQLTHTAAATGTTLQSQMHYLNA